MGYVSSAKKSTTPSGGWSDLWKQEDYWAVWLGLTIVVLAIVFWSNGINFMNWIVLKIPSYSYYSTAISYVSSHMTTLLTLYLFFLILFSIAVKALTGDVKRFLVGFTFLFLLSVLVSVWGSWDVMKRYNIETPLLALVVGLVISNLFKIPYWLSTALQTQFYIKLGIVLMGASLPFTLIVKAGTTAFAQATIIALATFLTIYWTGTRILALDKRFAATLAAGGSICGVSASIAIGGAVKAEKQHVSIAISMVILWSIIMIFILPLAIKALNIPPGPAGAWIGTAEFADAPGMAAAAAINEQAIKTFTLMKVVGRDMFIGIWCFIMAFTSVTRWEKRYVGTKPDALDVWIRFPKFVIGFFVASIIITFLAASPNVVTSKALDNKIINPIIELRNWAFIFTFLSIGLTSRLKDLASVGWKPFAAFTAGVLVNIPLGYLLSVVIMGNYWITVK
ncbi:putative sulfate exporter family transporter [Desulfosporosinus sp.]|uniref:YeiH family protein n=1 Tax=Desulfosporosinus sp. TaxID=157907 RepID=UPI0023188EE8|nr:putative sulfate exporter family transporter [Desulfosporosinus sp.]MCO5385111.1 YeiH family protein [Desulfosporosinus sp.]MDA8222213.1 putative sulfate exporter family transporter [Desulfitobacterium hafniense]